VDTPQSFRYHIKDFQFVAMNHGEEYEWVYESLANEVIKKFGEEVAKYIFLPITNNRLYVYQDPNEEQLPTYPIELEELSMIARDLGVTAEDIELKEFYFHLVDSKGVLHGFDLRDFESRNQIMLDSFASIIDKHFNYDQACIPIKLPSYLSSSLCDAFILVFLHEYKPAIGELIDFTHPDYINVNKQTTWVKELP
jgi:hypothetical protein